MVDHCVTLEERARLLSELLTDLVTGQAQIVRILTRMSVVMDTVMERINRHWERIGWAEEQILVLEHGWDNPIMVDDDSNEETVVSNGESVEIEENKVAIPIPPPGHLVLIKDDK